VVAREKRLRISAGRFGGRVIAAPTGIRPTAGRIREALMSIWQHELEGSAFLDLFAGSGAVGIEALSRGAVEAEFIDCDPRVIAILEANLELLRVEEVAVKRLRLPHSLERLDPDTGRRFDLVFADPPYRFDAYRETLVAVGPWVSERGRVAVEHGVEEQLESVCRLELVDRRIYGDSALSLYRRISD